MRIPKKQKRTQTVTKVFENLGQASAALGVSVGTLKRAKRAGAPGFHSTRIYPRELLPWLRAWLKKHKGQAAEKELLEMRKLRGECERIEFRNSVEAKKFWPAQEVREAWLKHIMRARKVWNDVSESLPPQLVGRTVLEIQNILIEAVDRAIEQLRTDPYGDAGA